MPGPSVCCTATTRIVARVIRRQLVQASEVQISCGTSYTDFRHVCPTAHYFSAQIFPSAETATLIRQGSSIAIP